ncbi:unnamed protein product [Caenorhabditis brenneri]
MFWKHELVVASRPKWRRIIKWSKLQEEMDRIERVNRELEVELENARNGHGTSFSSNYAHQTVGRTQYLYGDGGQSQWQSEQNGQGTSSNPVGGSQADESLAGILGLASFWCADIVKSHCVHFLMNDFKKTKMETFEIAVRLLLPELVSMILETVKTTGE